MEEEELEKLLPRNIFTLEVKISKLNDQLNKITPKKGNFLFTDLVGRIVWHACATSNSVLILAKEYNDYGVKSLSRKIYECYILLNHLFSSKDKPKEIAKILAYEYQKEDNLDTGEIISTVEKIVYTFKENRRIIDEFKNQIKQKRKHWHWAGKSFKTMLVDSNKKIGIPEFDEKMFILRLGLLKSFNQNAHIDLELDKDFLMDSVDGTYRYCNPKKKSKLILYQYIGLIRLILNDIIELLKENEKSFANIGYTSCRN